MLESAQALITKTAEKMKLDQEMIKRLIEPEFSHEFALTITMDSGKNKVFKGWRIQHNSALGPYKGGIRFHSDTSVTCLFDPVNTFYRLFDCGNRDSFISS